jgi:eukaryotic-like serine/threonine-protein kinase
MRGRVATLIRDAARALHTVHEQGIIHRDVKPANLMLTPDGTRVVLMDFGLAKGQTRSLTASHQAGFLGTLRYAAPEQLAAATLEVGPPADVRALGVTLWELLTRRRLFDDAADEKQLATAVHERDVPRLRSIDPAFDRDLEAIAARATERRASDRIQTARQLADYLDLYLEGKPLPIRTPSGAELVQRWIRDHTPLVASLAGALYCDFRDGYDRLCHDHRFQKPSSRGGPPKDETRRTGIQGSAGSVLTGRDERGACRTGARSSNFQRTSAALGVSPRCVFRTAG